MIGFNCSNCDHRISVAEEHVGKKGKCPKCKQVVTVPSLSMVPHDQTNGPIQNKPSGGYTLSEPVSPVARPARIMPTEKTAPPKKRSVKLAIVIIIAVCVVLPGLVVKMWFDGTLPVGDSDLLLSRSFEAAAQEQLPKVLSRSEDAWELFDRMRAGESVEQAMKNAADQATRSDYSACEVVRVEVKRLIDSEDYDAVGTAFWEDTGQPDGDKGSFKLGRRMADQTWVEYKEPPDPRLVQFVEQTQPLIKEVRRIASLREVGGNVRDYTNATVDLRTARQGAPAYVDDNSKRFLEAIDSAADYYARAVRSWSALISMGIGGASKDQEVVQLFEAADEQLESAMRSYEYLEIETGE